MQNLYKFQDFEKIADIY